MPQFLCTPEAHFARGMVLPSAWPDPGLPSSPDGSTVSPLRAVGSRVSNAVGRTCLRAPSRRVLSVSGTRHDCESPRVSTERDRIHAQGTALFAIPQHLPIPSRRYFRGMQFSFRFFPLCIISRELTPWSRGSGATTSGSVVPTFPGAPRGDAAARGAARRVGPSVSPRLPHRAQDPSSRLRGILSAPSRPEAQVPRGLPQVPTAVWKRTVFRPRGKVGPPLAAPRRTRPPPCPPPGHVVIPDLARRGQGRALRYSERENREATFKGTFLTILL